MYYEIPTPVDYEFPTFPSVSSLFHSALFMPIEIATEKFRVKNYATIYFDMYYVLGIFV